MKIDVEIKKEIKKLTKVIKQQKNNPDAAEARYCRAYYYFALNNHSAAIKDLRAAIKLESKENHFFQLLGSVYSESGRHNEAIKCFNKCLEIDKADFNTLYKRAWAYIAIEDYDNAMNDLQLVEKSDSDSESLYLSKGYIHFQLKQFNEAIKEYTKAIELKSDNPKTLMNRGSAYKDLGQYEKALQDYMKIYEISAGPEICYEIGVIYKILKNDDKAAEYFKRSIKYNEKDFRSYYLLLEIYFHQNKYVPATEICNYLIGQRNDFYAHLFLGLICHNTRKWDDALRHFDSAISVSPQNWFLYFYKGKVYSELKEWNSAVINFKKAAEFNAVEEIGQCLKIAQKEKSKRDKLVTCKNKADKLFFMKNLKLYKPLDQMQRDEKIQDRENFKRKVLKAIKQTYTIDKA